MMVDGVQNGAVAGWGLRRSWVIYLEVGKAVVRLL